MNKLVYVVDRYIRVTKETKYLVLELCSSFAGLILLYAGALVQTAHESTTISILQEILSGTGLTLSAIGIGVFVLTLLLGNYTRYQNQEGVDRTFLVSGSVFVFALIFVWPITLFELLGYGFGFIMLIHIFVSSIRIGLSFYKSAEYGEHIDPPPPLSELSKWEKLPSNPVLRKIQLGETEPQDFNETTEQDSKQQAKQKAREQIKKKMEKEEEETD